VRPYQSLLLLFLILNIITLLSPAYAVETGTEPWQGAYTTEAFAGGAIRDVYCDLVGLTEGTFGGLLFTVAGLVAIAMGVFGEGGQSKNILVVAIGAVAISTAVSLYFGDMGCGSGSSKGQNGANGQNNGAAKVATDDSAKEFKFPALFDGEQADAVPSQDLKDSEAELF